MAHSIWNIQSKETFSSTKELIITILKNREIFDIDKFLNPPDPFDFVLQDETFSSLLNEKIANAILLIKKAIVEKRPIIIHGDYDVDGQTATAIMWKTLFEDMGYTNTFPFIPSRFDEGYGLTKASLDAMQKLIESKGFSMSIKPLVITVDCGITAVNETKLCKEMGFEIILTDHHKPKDELPEPDILVWTDKPTGAGISWLLSRVLLLDHIKTNKHLNLDLDKYLDLACLGTICDLQPLLGFNRSIVKFGLDKINKLNNKGILALKNISGIINEIDTYEVGWVLGPRLNAAGRLETAMDSLRLLSTNSENQAIEIANSLNELNKTRQDKTFNDYNMASKFLDKVKEEDLPDFIVTDSNEYHDGIIGLMAAKLVQGFNRPAIVIAIEENSKIAKGSGRSIKGISIIDKLKYLTIENPDLFVNLGGHDMACGFSIEVDKIKTLKSLLSKSNIDKTIFKKVIEIDAELPDTLISLETVKEIIKLKPFGTGNPEPVFVTKNLKVLEIDFFGKTLNHVKISLLDMHNNKIKAIAFNFAEKVIDIHPNIIVDVVYQLTNNIFNGKDNLEMKIRDLNLTKF